jgi:hypothetical protein
MFASRVEVLRCSRTDTRIRNFIRKIPSQWKLSYAEICVDITFWSQLEHHPCGRK